MDTKTITREQCMWCGQALRSNARRRYTVRLSDGIRYPIHGTCKHRFESDGCYCDICTGDIH